MKPFPVINIDRIPEVANRILSRYTIDEEQSDEANFVSVLGTPVYSNLEFLKTSGTSADNSQAVGEQRGNSQTLLRIDSCVMVVTQTKEIVRTAIQGRNGTVKEYISDGDFMVNIRGAIMSDFPNVYPREDVELFIEIMGLKKSIPIASMFLDMFSIQEMVVENYLIAEKLGSRNEVPFEINALSDYPIEFKLNATS